MPDNTGLFQPIFEICPGLHYETVLDKKRNELRTVLSKSHPDLLDPVARTSNSPYPQ